MACIKSNSYKSVLVQSWTCKLRNELNNASWNEIDLILIDWNSNNHNGYDYGV